MRITSPGSYIMRNGGIAIITKHVPGFYRFNWVGFLPNGKPNAWMGDGLFDVLGESDFDIVSRLTFAEENE